MGKRRNAHAPEFGDEAANLVVNTGHSAAKVAWHAVFLPKPWEVRECLQSIGQKGNAAVDVRTRPAQTVAADES